MFAMAESGSAPVNGRGLRRPATRRTAVAAAGWGAVLAACGAPGPAEQAKQLKTGITLLWGGSGNSASRIALHRQQADLFERKFPGIKVEIVPDGENLDKIKAGLAAGTPMDLVSMNTRYAVFARQSALVAFDPFVARDKYDLKDFFPAPLATWQWRGKLWAMPFNGIQTPYVNLAVTEESGARRPPASWSDPTWNWEAFLDYCRKVSRQEGGRTVQWGFTGGQGNIRVFMAWVWGNGGDMFDKDLTRVTLGDPPALEGLQFQADLINKYHFMPHPDELSAIGGSGGPFLANKAGINVGAVGNIATNRRTAGLRWTVTAMPRGAKNAFIGGGGSGWFMLAGGRSDETWELLKVVESPEGDRMVALAGEAPPARRSVARDPDYLNPKEAPGADMKVVVESMETAFRPDPILVQGDEIINIVQNELNPAWSGQRSVSQSVEVIKARVEPLLKAERQ